MTRKELSDLKRKPYTDYTAKEKEFYKAYIKSEKTRRGERFIILGSSFVCLLVALFGKTPEAHFGGTFFLFLINLLSILE